MDYTPRSEHWPAIYGRIVLEDSAGAVIGPTGLALCFLVAAKEADLGYSEPVCWANSTVQKLLGITENTLLEARRRSVKAGWLAYEARGTRLAGLYRTRIPGE